LGDDREFFFFSRAEEVSEATDQGQQHPAEDAGHVRRGGRPEEIVRTALKTTPPPPPHAIRVV